MSWSRMGWLAGGILFAGGRVSAQTQLWNLPYVRPAAYDYTSEYSPSMNTYLATNPSYFKKVLANAWTYYKQNFIMSNGLVNHQAWQNNAVVGKDSAVSEGQGYGMLLALLNNDQTTFNSIFEAANTYMWDDSHKSYFKWNYPTSAQGAATDADLDIGLSLVFADALQKSGLWQTYNKNSITYQSRAMDIILSVHANMVSQNYLLPGDNWGSDGINNLDPSYFSTAWLKVFDAYQTQVDFTSVIDNCYAVLAKMPRYNIGQAVDWCNTSGGQSSQGGGKQYQGLGMLSDAIRTPYRIAMDALWFNDSRAIAYCKNSMGTLTQYNNSNILLMAAQMAQYDNTGTSITSTRGSFENVAMWSVAVLGSKDTAFTHKALHSSVFNIISGGNSTYLGSVSLEDNEFYFMQSIGMLGLAAVGGQFPNVFADVKTPVVSVIQPLQKHSDGLPTLMVNGGVVLFSPGTPGLGNAKILPAAGALRNVLGQATHAVLP